MRSILIVGNLGIPRKHGAAALGHHDQSRRELDQLVHDAPLSDIRFGQDRVERGHNRQRSSRKNARM